MTFGAGRGATLPRIPEHTSPCSVRFTLAHGRGYNRLASMPRTYLPTARGL